VLGGGGLRSPSLGQGDLGGNVTAIFVYRNWNARTFGDHWHFLHEPQITIGGGFGSDVSGHGDVAIAADLLHHSWDTGIGQFDWHALSAQIGGGGAYTGEAGLRGEGSVGLGSGVEWHPGNQNRFSITAALNITGNVGFDNDQHRYVFNAAATPTLGFTWNIVGP
jgi:hypothetical protein